MTWLVDEVLVECQAESHSSWSLLLDVMQHVGGYVTLLAWSKLTSLLVYTLLWGKVVLLFMVHRQLFL